MKKSNIWLSLSKSDVITLGVILLSGGTGKIVKSFGMFEEIELKSLAI